MGIPNYTKGRLDIDDVLRARLLATAPTDPCGAQTATEFLAELSDARFASLALQKRLGRPLIQPRGGFARFDDQRQLTTALFKAGADFIPLTIDSHSRHNDYDTAAILLERSELEDKNLLNGYPLVNHGYKTSRHIFKDIERPISLRHGTPDARLLVETALAAGITEIEGGALTYTTPYSRSFPIMRALSHWQYVDRLCAMHSTQERPIHRESFGALTATLVPPVMVSVVQLCELLLAAEQGVKSFSVSFSQTGSIVQDLALARILREMSSTYLTRFGFDDVDVYLVYHQWMGAFPYDYDRAISLISSSAQIAALVGADKVVCKTKEEARGIPTINNNAEAVKLVKFVLEHATIGAVLHSSAVEAEVMRIKKQTDAVMDAIFDLPSELFWNSVGIAFETGMIDIPFSPHETNANAVRTRRGRDNGIYITDPGKIPLPLDTLSAEKTALAARPQGAIDETYFKSVMRDINLMAG